MSPELIGNRIKSLMIVKKVNRKELANKIGISYNTLTKKLNGQREFGIIEILKIKEIFELNSNECADLFFNEEFFFIAGEKIV